MSYDPAVFELSQAKQAEARRKLLLLGNLAHQAFHYEHFYERAFTVRVPLSIFKQWHEQFQQSGLAGLLPHDWTELEESAKQAAWQRYQQMHDLVNVEIMESAIEAELAIKMRCSLRTAERWLTRYQIGGLWGLARNHNPLKAQSKKSTEVPPRAIGSFDEETLEIVYQRFQMLGNLVESEQTTDAAVAARAAEVNVSKRTLWNYLKDYRKYGLAGLAPKQRADKGQHHNISERMIALVQSIRLTHPDWRVRAVYEMACSRAVDLGEIPPSEWQVRTICESIPGPVRSIADGRENEFRNRYRITYPMQFNGVIYQIDHNLVDVLVRDQRSRKYRATSGEVRPWLTLVIESSSRVVVATKFSYDRPDRHRVAGVIRSALLAKPGGKPDEIWVDNGKDLISRHVQELTREMGIHLHNCAPHQPQHRGICERFFGTINTRLWAALPGYVNSNTVERNPKARALLTVQELEKKFQEFLAQYHAEPHNELGMTPLAYWNEHCFAQPVDDIRRLDTLLLEATNRNVIKTGIKYEARQYWHTELATIVGQQVLIRADTAYEAPDEIEVYHDGHWLCTAFALDSERGRSVTQVEIAAAQRQQREAARQQVNAAKTLIQEVDQQNKVSTEVIRQGPAKEMEQTTTSTMVTHLATAEAKPKVRLSNQRKKDVLESLGEEEV